MDTDSRVLEIRGRYITGEIGYSQALVELRDKAHVETLECINVAATWIKDREAYEVCTDMSRKDCTGCPYEGSGHCPEVM